MANLSTCEGHGEDVVVVYNWTPNRQCPLCEAEEKIERLEDDVKDLQEAQNG